MTKVTIFILLFFCYTMYSFLVYTKGTETAPPIAAAEQQNIRKGKQLFQEYNCTACHQLYGLGGYLGPDLTTAWSDKTRGEAFIRAMLMSGGARMPQYKFTEAEVTALTAYLKFADRSFTTSK
jgi:nitric oxide reductase subunit C